MSYSMRHFFTITPQLNESLNAKAIPSAISNCNNQIKKEILYLFPSHERKDIFKQQKQKCNRIKSNYEEYLLSQKRKQKNLILKSLSDKLLLNLMMKKKNQLNDCFALTSKEVKDDISYLKQNLLVTFSTI